MLEGGICKAHGGEIVSFEKLVKVYAHGRPICNCGRAYYSVCSGKLSCVGGCQSNQYNAADDIAGLVLKDIESMRNALALKGIEGEES